MVESLKYKVLEKKGNIEIRQYRSYIQAEVEVCGDDHRSAAEKGFRILAGYIFGENRSKKKIDMTSPVKTETSEKIPMASPVKVTGQKNYKVAFIMPSKYKRDDLPIPDNEDISFKKIDREKIAAIRFSGYFDPKKIEKNTELLLDYIKEKGLYTDDEEIVVAGYSPPYIPWFLSKNEVMIRLI